MCVCVCVREWQLEASFRAGALTSSLQRTGEDEKKRKRSTRRWRGTEGLDEQKTLTRNELEGAGGKRRAGGGQRGTMKTFER